MMTTIDNNQRIFVITAQFNSGGNPVLCNLSDIENVCKSMSRGVASIKHFWNGKVTRISHKDVIEMLKSHDLNYKFPPLA